MARRLDSFRLLGSVQRFLGFLPASFRETLFVRVFGWFQVPLIGYLRPRVIEVSDRRVRVLLPLRWRTRNHLGSMYFGALAAGADIAGGLIAMRSILRRGARVDLVFQTFQAEFLRRAQGDVEFVCEQGEAIAELVERAIRSGERESLEVQVVARLVAGPRTSSGDVLETEPVARFRLRLSLKRRGEKTGVKKT
jgi:acyl-coenzyme A thioesterase PaaI-like protein